MKPTVHCFGKSPKADRRWFPGEERSVKPSDGSSCTTLKPWLANNETAQFFRRDANAVLNIYSRGFLDPALRSPQDYRAGCREHSYTRGRESGVCRLRVPCRVRQTQG